MKSFLLKMGLFLGILLVAQIVVSALYPPELPAEIVQLEGYLEEEVDIIYFGDSTVSYPLGDRTTGDILQEMLPDHRLGEVAHPAYNLDLYLRYVEYILRSDHRPAQIIMPINLRSFSPEWDLRPDYQFAEEKTILSYGLPLSTILYKPLDTLGGFDPAISQAQFLNTTVYNGQTPVGTVADFEALTASPLEEQDNNVEFAYHDRLPDEENIEALRGVLTYYYMYELSPTHRKMESLLRVIDLLQENDIEPIFYITPINYQLGQRHLGEEFVAQVTENAALVETTLQAADVTLLNLVFALEAYQFVDTEHMREGGKTFIAEQLAAHIAPAPSEFLTEAGPATATLPATPTGTRVVWRTATPTVSPTRKAATPLPLSGSVPASDTPLADPPPEATAEATVPPSSSPSAPEPSPTSVPSPTNTRVVAASVEVGALGRVVSNEYINTYEPEAAYAVDRYRVRFQTLDENEQLVQIQADLYFPRVTAPESFPVIVYGAGTTGVSSGCGPLDEQGSGRNWGQYNDHMISYAAQGYIGILPNWIGFDDSDRTHPYFIAEPAGRTMLDSARAVYDFFENHRNETIAAEPMAAVFFGGYSSGGHAAFAARDYATRYAPELPIKGIIGHGPTTNIETLMRENPVFTPYTIYAYREFYGNEVIHQGDVFLSGWLPTFDQDILTQCVDEIFVYYAYTTGEMYRERFTEALLTENGLRNAFPAFKAVLDENATGYTPEGSDIPVLILQGTADMVISPPSQAQFAATLCSLGGNVTYLTYPAVSHSAVRRESFFDTITWMDNLAAGLSPQSDCASLLGQ